MKKFTVVSDAGSFLFGDENFGIRVNNLYGDCDSEVLVFDSDEEFTKYVKENYKFLEDPIPQFHFMNSIEGKFNLYNHDCAERIPENIKCKFNGRYFLYVRCEEFEHVVLAIVKM